MLFDILVEYNEYDLAAIQFHGYEFYFIWPNNKQSTFQGKGSHTQKQYAGLSIGHLLNLRLQVTQFETEAVQLIVTERNHSKEKLGSPQVPGLARSWLAIQKWSWSKFLCLCLYSIKVLEFMGL